MIKNSNESDDSAKEEALHYIANFEEISTKLMSNDGLDSFERRDSDIIISSFPKSGNALISQMCYQIAVASGGGSEKDKSGMEFEDLAQIAPWIEQMKMLGLQPWESKPRIFKTHLPIPKVLDPSKGKYILVVRNPELIPHSMLNFLFDTLGDDEFDQRKAGDAVREQCVNLMMERFILGKSNGNDDGLGAWHGHLKSSLEVHDERMLILFYEQVVAHLADTVQKIAKFMDCDLSPTGLSTVVQRCDQNYMANDQKFHGLLEKRVMGLPCEVRHTQPKTLIGFKKFKICHEVAHELESMNLKAFGVATYDEIVEKLSNKYC